MAGIKDAIDEIAVAEKENNGSVIGQYLSDKRPSVRTAATNAFNRMKANPVEDNTPLPANSEELSAIAHGKPLPKTADVPPAADDRNAPIMPNKWIEMSEEEAAEHEANGLLVGYDPANGRGLLKQ